MVFWPVFTAPAGFTLFGDDFFRSYSFFREFFRDEIRKGNLPLWNPYLFAGSPLVANPSVSFLYPLNFLYVLLPVTDAWEILTIIQLGIAFAGMYWFCRRVLGTAGEGAAFAALSFTFSGYFMSRIWAGHTEILSSAPYIPWVIGLYVLVSEKFSVRRLIVFAFVLSFQIAAGYQTIALFTLEACLVLGAVYSIARRSPAPLVYLAAGTAGAAALAGYELLPKLEYFRESIRTFTFGYDWAAYGSVTADNFRQLLSPFALGDKLSYNGSPPNYPEQSMYAGAVTLAMAAVGLITAFMGRNRKLIPPALGLVAIAVFACLIALGSNAPVNLHRFLWEIVPMYRNMRIPPRHLILAVFGLAAIAGIGVSRLRLRFWRYAVTGVLLAELVFFGRHFILVREKPGTLHDRELISTVTGTGEPGRILQNFGVWVPPRDALDFDAVMPYRIFSATGYDPSILRKYYEFADASIGNTGPSVTKQDVQIPYLDVFSPGVNFLNIRYLIVPPEYDPASWYPGVTYRLNREDLIRGYRLYENPDALPRYYLTGAVRTMSAEMVYEEIRTRKADLARTAYVTGGGEGAVTDCEPGQILPPVSAVSYTTDRIELSVSPPCNAFLVTSEVMYPGWKVTVDGISQDIKTVNLAFRGIFVPRGPHTIVFRFRPRLWYFGIAVTALAVTGSVIVWKRASRQAAGS